MNKYFQRVVLVAVAMATAQMAVAESWRINNDTSIGAHFASINDAMASEEVLDGDVLYLDPGCVLTAEQTVSKAVTVIGTGWDFNNRPYPYAQVSTLKITAAAKIEGLYVTGSLYALADNVSIERCRIDGDIKNNVSGYLKTYNHLQVISSYIYSGSLAGASSSSCYQYATISNCIIYVARRTLEYLTNATITNNVLISASSSYDVLDGIKNSVIKNNIMMNIKSSSYNRMESERCSGNSFMNNCMSADATTSYAADDANVCTGVYDLSAVFLNDGSAGGATYKLCEGSPAIGAGENGIDCGAYAEGSLYPFVTYGMPKHIPYFTRTSVPVQPTDGKVKVSLKIVNQND